MKLQQIFNERDSAIINQLLVSVPREQRGDAFKELKKLFLEGHNSWLYKSVPAGHDPEKAKELVDMIQNATVTKPN